MRIIFPNGNGISVIIPTGVLLVTETARKDVPQGVPYLVVSESVIPSADMDLWEADFSNPDGYGIGADAWFAAQGNEK